MKTRGRLIEALFTGFPSCFRASNCRYSVFDPGCPASTGIAPSFSACSISAFHSAGQSAPLFLAWIASSVPSAVEASRSAAPSERGHTSFMDATDEDGWYSEDADEEGTWSSVGKAPKSVVVSGFTKIDDREDHLSAMWISPDGDFQVYRDSDGWILHSLYDKNTARFKASGLDKARFKTRREAAAHLTLFLEQS